MAIYGRYPDRTFTPCPEGLHQAVCVDVVDLGEVDTAFGRKYRVRLAWQLEDVDQTNGRRHTAVKSYTNSLHKRATLRADLETWRGRKFTEDEAKRFDLETLLGVNAMLHIVHDTGDDGAVFANVRAVLPVRKGAPKLTAVGYTRHQDRPSSASSARPTMTWPNRPTPTPAEPQLDTPWPADSAPAETVSPAVVDSGDDIAFAFGANTGEVQ